MAARQENKDERTDHYGQRAAAITAFVDSHLRMHLGEGSDAHRPVGGVLACVLSRGFGPGARVLALHRRAVATWSAGEGGDQRGSDGRRSDAQLSNGRGFGTDAPQAPAAASRDHRGGVEDEQRNGLYFYEPAQQDLHLLGGDLVGVLGGPDALYVHGGGPTLADEVELCDELVGPSGHDRMAEWREGW